MKLWINYLIILCLISQGVYCLEENQVYEMSQPYIQIGNQYFYTYDSPCMILGENIIVNGKENQGIYLENITIHSIEQEDSQIAADLEIIYDLQNPELQAKILVEEGIYYLVVNAYDDYYIDRIVYSKQELTTDEVLDIEDYIMDHQLVLEVEVGERYYLYAIDEMNNISVPLIVDIIEDHDMPVVEIEYLSGMKINDIQYIDSLDIAIKAYDTSSTISSISLYSLEELVESSQNSEAIFHITSPQLEYQLVVEDFYGNQSIIPLVYQLDTLSPIIKGQVNNLDSIVEANITDESSIQEYRWFLDGLLVDYHTVENQELNIHFDLEGIDDGQHCLILTTKDCVGHQSSQSFNFELDTIAPQLNINDDHDEDYCNYPVTFYIEAIDLHLDFIEMIQNGMAQRIENNSSIILEQEGEYTIQFIAYDQFGNSTSSPIYRFMIDFSPPIIQCDYSGGNYINHSIDISYLIEEENIESIQSNYEYSRNGNWVILHLSEDGYYEPILSVRDLAGNYSSISLSGIYIDQSIPQIITHGIENQGSYQAIDTIEVSLIDEHLRYSSIELITSSGQLIPPTTSTIGYYQISGDVLEDGSYTLSIYVDDFCGNINRISYTFLINSNGSSYINSCDPSIEISENNLSPIVNRYVLLNSSGIVKECEENRDYQVEIIQNEDGKYSYHYFFNEALFEMEGSYIITIYSIDEAGNRSNNVENLLEIQVDNTTPFIPLDSQEEIVIEEMTNPEQIQVQESVEKQDQHLDEIESMEEIEVVNSIQSINQHEKSSKSSYLLGAFGGVLILIILWRRKNAIKS